MYIIALAIAAGVTVLGIASVGLSMAFFGRQCVKHLAEQPTTKNDVSKLFIIGMSLLELFGLGLLILAFMTFMRLVK
jgi:F0F1-type ATP synthase membrane subunit c/vacuolar-type H+-ATPase subunit K